MDFIGDFFGFLPVLLIFLALPWLFLHYVTKWRTSSGGITNQDEALLEELYDLTRRLGDRMDTVERLVAHDHSDFKPARLIQNTQDDRAELDELEALLAEKRVEQRALDEKEPRR